MGSPTKLNVTVSVQGSPSNERIQDVLEYLFSASAQNNDNQIFKTQSDSDTKIVHH